MCKLFPFFFLFLISAICPIKEVKLVMNCFLFLFYQMYCFKVYWNINSLHIKINSNHGISLNLFQRISPLQSFACERSCKPLKKVCVLSLHGHLCHHLQDTLTSIRCTDYDAKNGDYFQHYICHQGADQISMSAPHFAGLNFIAESCFILILTNLKYIYSDI